MPALTVDEQLRILSAGAVDVITEADLRRKLGRGTPVRVKLGIDPTASDIHLGFAVVLRKLRQFQELGHSAVLIIGDFTAAGRRPVGAVRDPAPPDQGGGRRARGDVPRAGAAGSSARPPRDPAQLRVARRRWASRTCCASPPARRSPACSSATTSPSATASGSPISVMEFLYPLLQGWDSVMVEADVELGGTDQLFNNLVGRDAPGAGGPGGAGRADHAAARGARRRQEDVEVARQLRRDRRAARRAVRQADVAPRRAHAASTSSSRPVGTPTGSTRSPPRCATASWRRSRPSGCSPAPSSTCTTVRVRGRRRGRVRPGVPGATSRPTEIPEHVLDAAEAIDGRIQHRQRAAPGRPRGLQQGGPPPDRAGRCPHRRRGRHRSRRWPCPPTDLDGVTLQVGRRRWVRIRTARDPPETGGPGLTRRLPPPVGSPVRPRGLSADG